MAVTKSYTASQLLDRWASELAYERILAGDLRAQMDNPHYSLTSEERRGLSELYVHTFEKIAVLEKLTNCGHVSVSSSQQMIVSHSNEPHNDVGQEMCNRRLEDKAEVGMLAYASLTPGQQLRMQAMMFVNKRHGGIKVTPYTLHQLPEEIRHEVRAFLHVVLGENPKATEMIVEVLRAPKRLRNK